MHSHHVRLPAHVCVCVCGVRLLAPAPPQGGAASRLVALGGPRGVPRNLTMLPAHARVCVVCRLARRASSWRVLSGAELLASRVRVYSWWCPSVNSFKFQPCDRIPPRTQRLMISHKVQGESFKLTFPYPWSASFMVKTTTVSDRLRGCVCVSVSVCGSRWRRCCLVCGTTQRPLLPAPTLTPSPHAHYTHGTGLYLRQWCVCVCTHTPLPTNVESLNCRKALLAFPWLRIVPPPSSFAMIPF